MRIAVSYEKGMVFQHFGKCPGFLMIEAEEGKLVGRSLLSSNGSGHSALVALMQQEGIEVLICGGIGQGARSALQAAGIRLISGAKGNAEVAIDQFLAGTLQDDPSGQCHHQHEEGTHHCGEHGCE